MVSVQRRAAPALLVGVFTALPRAVALWSRSPGPYKAYTLVRWSCVCCLAAWACWARRRARRGSTRQASAGRIAASSGALQYTTRIVQNIHAGALVVPVLPCLELSHSEIGCSRVG